MADDLDLDLEEELLQVSLCVYMCVYVCVCGEGPDPLLVVSTTT